MIGTFCLALVIMLVGERLCPSAPGEVFNLARFAGIIVALAIGMCCTTGFKVVEAHGAYCANCGCSLEECEEGVPPIR